MRRVTPSDLVARLRRDPIELRSNRWAPDAEVVVLRNRELSRNGCAPAHAAPAFRTSSLSPGPIAATRRSERIRIARTTARLVGRARSLVAPRRRSQCRFRRRWRRRSCGPRVLARGPRLGDELACNAAAAPRGLDDKPVEMTSPAVPTNDEASDERVVDACNHQCLTIVCQKHSCLVNAAGKTCRTAFTRPEVDNFVEIDDLGIPNLHAWCLSRRGLRAEENYSHSARLTRRSGVAGQLTLR